MCLKHSTSTELMQKRSTPVHYTTKWHLFCITSSTINYFQHAVRISVKQAMKGPHPATWILGDDIERPLVRNQRSVRPADGILYLDIQPLFQTFWIHQPIIIYCLSHSYMTGVVAAELWWHLPNMKLIEQIYRQQIHFQTNGASGGIVNINQWGWQTICWSIFSSVKSSWSLKPVQSMKRSDRTSHCNEVAWHQLRTYKRPTLRDTGAQN